VLQPSTFDARITLVDHGGTDILDASLSPVGVTLDLRAGSTSSVGLTAEGRVASRNVAVGVDTEIEYAVGTPYDDVLIGNHLDNRFWALAGNDWIEGGDGIDAVTFSARSSSYRLEFSETGLALEALDRVSGFVSMHGVEQLIFSNKTVDLQTKSHDGYDDLPESLYHFFIVAFSAAPGVTYMDQLAEAYRYGLSIEKIVDAFISKSQFTDVYPLSLSNAELSKRLVENIVKGSASAEVKAGAAKDIEGALDLGWTRGKVIYTVFGNLAGKPLSDETWGDTAQFFQNEIAVAKHYTEVLNQSTTDLQTLRDVLSAVGYTDDVTTEAAIEALISQGLLVGAASQADSGGNGV
jgi:hypothetical protein